jgi:DNA-binding LacI/PurR family transcriptional regulator/AraC-like DNA-binding protein
MSERRIGLIVPHIVTNVDRELISGIFDRLKVLNADLVIITGISNFSLEKRNDPYALGAENIFNIITKGQFDAFIFAADWFVDADLKAHIYQLLINRNLPCVVLEEENQYFPYIFPEQCSFIRELTEHMILKHNCRILYFLSGFKGHYASVERIKGFCQALDDNGIHFSEDCVFYGDFWKEKPAELGRKIALGEIEKPDAVICACDTMAVSLIDSLIVNGMRVPEDIKVTGYDGKTEALIHFPTVTTIVCRNYQLGIDAAEKICRIIGISDDNFICVNHQHTVYRMSCGCNENRALISPEILAEIRRPDMFHLERYVAMTTDFVDKILDNNTLEELMLSASMYSYRIPNWKGLTVCLCDDWKFNFTDTSYYRKSNYSDKIEIAIEMNAIGGFCNICKNSMEISEVIPQNIMSDSPKVWLLTSLHCKGQIFGYICTGYDKPDDIFLDDNYCIWCDTLSKGLQEIQKRLYRRYVNEQISRNFDRDPETDLISRKNFINKASEFIESHENAVLQFFFIDSSSKSDNKFNFTSMVSVALKRTSRYDELVTKLEDNVFAVIYSNSMEKSENTVLYERLDKIEYELLGYDTKELHITLPYIFTTLYKINKCDLHNVDSIIDKKICAMQCYLSEHDINDYYINLNILRRKIKLHPNMKWNLKVLADSMHMSQSQFQRLYRQTFGISCIKDVINMKLDRAKLMLSGSNMTVSEISSACGYLNESHFMRQFHERFGITAIQYRLQNQFFK